MNSYLSLVREYDRAHKKKSRLTVICIAISVMLVTAIFGMADMSIQAQISERIRQGGNFHAVLADVPEDVANGVAARPDVAVSGYIGGAKNAQWQGHTLRILGGERDIVEQMNLKAQKGRYPETAEEALIDQAALEQFGLSIGDAIDVTLSDGQIRRYVITGSFDNFSSLQSADAHGLTLGMAGVRAMPEAFWEQYYIQFGPNVNINQAVADIQREYGLADHQVIKNTILLGLMGQSDDSAMVQLYLTAGILFILVAMAGTFMIASSFNMSVLQRTQFFGLLRCLGATKKQVKRYIRVEGLRYCLKAIPIGLLAGCAFTWGALFVLNSLNSSYLPAMPMFQISLPGVAAGGALGFLVVMLASRSPAKKASSISPQAAVTGNINHTNNLSVSKASNTKHIHVDTSMGINHAFSNKKSMTLIAGSFALSIILFLCFTVIVDFMGNALKPLKPYAPDISVMGADDSILLNRSLMNKMQQLQHVKNIYGRMVSTGIPAASGQGDGTVTLISYDEPQFALAQDMLVAGNGQDVRNSAGALVSHSYAEKLQFDIGDEITLQLPGGNKKLQIAGILSDIPFDAGAGEWIMICSEATFTALTGISDYTIIDMQVDQDISDQVRRLITPDMRLMDMQRKNSEIRTMYNAMAVFVYGFLVVIGLVALINIINTVNASVASRTGNFGVMRAVGMSARQLKRMVLAEAASYAVTGMIAGSVLGLLLHRFLFEQIITTNWGELWQLPVMPFSIVIIAAILTTASAVVSPTRRISLMSIVNVVNDH